ncbi:alpha/beta hydrolase [Saccharomonospora piscinae]|uniref:alpha/beta hydrolase n=1 Tax=Saccharomonospora piscinae TaxID=687388 RepID=UPI001106E410|nr:alpha/beta hydrolase [Saccharomonospora piscinae]TLW94465.1 alpha/beta hydrolase [Saccharomonospora piscinae]
MPVGYLVTLLLLGLCTGLALAPLRSPRPLAVFSWVMSMVIAELPLLVLGFLLASTALAVVEDDLAWPAAPALLGLAAAIAAGQLVLFARTLRAAAVLRQALDQELGTGRPTGRAARSTVWRLWAALVPLPVPDLRVRRVRNLIYGDAGARHRLDLYRHRDTTTGPTLIYLHGGGYRSGRKSREARLLLTRLAARGWVCVAANYRLQPKAGFVEHVNDAKRVIAWVREHGADHGADPGTIVMAGSSAGGHLAALCALTPGESALEEGVHGADTTITAAVVLYGYLGEYYPHLHDESVVASTPDSYAHAHAPPVLVIHGDNDTFVPPDGARQFVAALRDRTTEPVVYAELPGAQHSFDRFPSVRFHAVVDAVEDFTDWVRLREGAQGARAVDDRERQITAPDAHG